LLKAVASFAQLARREPLFGVQAPPVGAAGLFVIM